MSTRMDEEDWAHTLTVFGACLPRRGRKGEDDRRFLEALHFFTLENVRWRALASIMFSYATTSIAANEQSS